MQFVSGKVAALLIALLLFGSGVLGQKKPTNSSWEQKPIDSWNEEDVKAILETSAWSKVIVGKPTHSSRQLGTVALESRLIFTLRSSLIVRYAIVRAEQLKEKFDSMDQKAKAEFGARFKPIIDCELCEKFYIVAVRGDSELLTQAGRVKNRASNIYLANEKGEKRELAKFTPQPLRGGEALFFFNRYDANGRPLLGPENTTLTFHFRNESGDDPVVTLLERVEIKVPDIVRENQVIF